jgi:hypothetical protein
VAVKVVDRLEAVEVQAENRKLRSPPIASAAMRSDASTKARRLGSSVSASRMARSWTWRSAARLRARSHHSSALPITMRKTSIATTGP